MLNKDSIESAIILAKLLRKEHRKIGELLDGTLVTMIAKESEMNCLNIDYSLSAIEEGEYDELVSKIRDAHLQKNTLEEEFGGNVESVECVHDSWITNYSRDIARAIENNLEFCKLIVIPQVKTLYEKLIAAHNENLEVVRETYFIVRDVVLPDYLTSEDYINLAQEHSTHEAVEKVDIDHTLTFSEDNRETIGLYVSKGGMKIGYHNSKNETSFNDDVTVVTRYLNADHMGENFTTNLTLKDLLTLVSFFNGVIEDPKFNSGRSGLENKQWGDYHLHKVMNELIAKTELVVKELKEGRLVSSLTNDIDYLFPRPSVDGEIKEVNCYLANFENLNTTLTPSELVGGLCVSNLPLSSVTVNTLTGEMLSDVAKNWNCFLTSTANSNNSLNKSNFEEKAGKIIKDFLDKNRRTYITCDAFNATGIKAETEEDIFEVAKTVVCDYLLHRTNARELFDAVQGGLDNNNETNIVSMDIVVQLVTNFMLGQIFLEGN